MAETLWTDAMEVIRAFAQHETDDSKATYACHYVCSIVLRLLGVNPTPDMWELIFRLHTLVQRTQNLPTDAKDRALGALKRLFKYIATAAGSPWDSLGRKSLAAEAETCLALWRATKDITEKRELLYRANRCLSALTGDQKKPKEGT